MLPRVNSRFYHAPLSSPIATLKTDERFPWADWIDSLPRYTLMERKEIVRPSAWEKEMRQLEILYACLHAFNPWSLLSFNLRRELDPGAPITNAFSKMIELCSLPEVDGVLSLHGGKCKPLNIVFLAEAPGLFPVAVIYYIGNRFPVFLRLDKLKYRCTTLPMKDKTKGEPGLGDEFSLIRHNAEKWYYMDHTSEEDTRRMIKDLGAGSQELVTGDIGKPIDSPLTAESELYREELGQFIAACALLKDGGVAVLKMFTCREYPTACILRTAMAVFDCSRIYKPRTSRPTNVESYWVLSGFKRALFEPLLDPLLAVLSTAAKVKGSLPVHFLKGEKGISIPDCRGFLPTDAFDQLLSDRLYRLHRGIQLRLSPFLQAALPCLDANRTGEDEPYAIQFRETRARAELTQPFVAEWMARFRLTRMGELFYEATGIKSTRIERRRVSTLSFSLRACVEDVDDQLKRDDQLD